MRLGPWCINLNANWCLVENATFQSLKRQGNLPSFNDARSNESSGLLHRRGEFQLDLVEVSIVIMNAIFVLLALSAIVGLALGFYFSWIAILVSGLVLAIVSATVLHNEGFGALAGIATIAVCLTVNQVAYLIGATMVSRGPRER